MSGKLPLSNPFAVGGASPKPVHQSAFNSNASPSSGVGTLPPGLGSSREKQDPWKEHHFQRRVRSLHSLETFGNPDGDDDDDDDEDEKWTRSYLSHHHVVPTPRTSSAVSGAAQPNNPFYCRNCDRDCYSEDGLRAHVAEHETCGVDGCPYTAHPKLVLNHYKTQHVTGLAAKVWKIQTPEDIAKWREDRKRNFPTVARTAQRKKEARERKKRGDVLKNQYFGKINGDTSRRTTGHDHRGRGGRGMHGERGMRGGRGMRGRPGGPGGSGSSSFKSIDKEFCSDSNASSSEDEDISAAEVINLQQSAVRDEKEPSPPPEQKTPATIVNADGVNILGGLASAYASSDDDEVVDDGRGGKGDVDGSAAVKDDIEDDVVEDNSKNNNSIGNNGASSEGTSLSKKKRRKRKKKNAEEEKPEFVDRLLTDGQVKYQLTKKRQRRNPTLLERLLAPEIRKERNVILQCVRYIVRKNFFEDK